MPPSSWLLAFQNHPKTTLKAERTITSTRLKQSTLLFQRGLPLPMNSLHLRLLVPVCGRPPSAPRRLDGVCEAQWRGSSHPRDNSPLPPPPTVQCCRVTVLEGAICILSHLSNHFLTSLEIPEPNHDYVNEGFGLIQGFGLFTLPLAGSGNFTRNLLFFRSWTSSWCHHE